jgi:predicted O-methyltransferase YrrM
VAAFHQLKSYLTYWFLNVDEHSLHSPFFYDFYTKVVKASNEPLAVAETLRQNLLSSNLTITVNDLGAGSVLNSPTRAVKDVAKTSLSTQKFSAIYARTIAHFQCKQVLELGTSFGINTLYLAHDNTTHVTTFEGAFAIAEIAKDTFRFSNTSNVRLIEGDITTTLPYYLRNTHKIDFAFVDANHRYEAVIRNFELLLDASHEKTILIFDDIHLNPEMEKAWKEIKANELVYATADLYRCGFIFLDPSLNRQHWILRF